MSETHSLYHVPLEQHHQISTENSLEVLKDQLDILIIPADISSVQSILHSSLTPSILNESKLQISQRWGYKYSIVGQQEIDLSKNEKVITNRDSHNVIVENGASFCSLFVLFNNEGQAFIWHVPIVSHVNKPIFNTLDLPLIQKFLQLGEQLNGKKYLLFTGTNEDNNSRDVLESVIRKEASNQGIETFTLFTQSKQEETEKLPNKMTHLLEGVIFIPKNQSVSGKNRILILSLNQST